MSWYEDKRKKKENGNLLSLGRGPIREAPEEKENMYPTAPATFTNEKFKSPAEPYIQTSIKKEEAEVNPKFKWNRGEEGYRNREFTYNVDEDPLYQQYLASAKRNGQNAMTDTIAKGAAMTGGIAGSYAVAAGAGAYNDYMQGVNDIIPELEQIAYARYQDELARDLKIHEMDEADRWEKAEVDSILQKHQNNGEPVSAEERKILNANGYYIDAEGNITAPDGNSYKAGDDFLTKAKDAYENYGWWGIPAEYRDALYKGGFRYDDAKGMMIDSAGMAYKTTATPEIGSEETYVSAYKAGQDITPYMPYLEKIGYSYKDGKLYNPEGTAISKYNAGKAVEDGLYAWETGGNITPYLDYLKEAGYEYDAISDILTDPEGNRVLNKERNDEINRMITLNNMIKSNKPLTDADEDFLISQGFTYNYKEDWGLEIPNGWVKEGTRQTLDEYLASQGWIEPLTMSPIEKHFAGIELTDADIAQLIDAGYDYRDGKIYYKEVIGGKEYEKELKESDVRVGRHGIGGLL